MTAGTTERTYRWLAKHGERAKEIRRRAVRRWRELHPEQQAISAARTREKRKEKIKEYNKIWSANNKHRKSHLEMLRYAGKKLRTPKWADLETIAVFYERARDISLVAGACHQVDHIIPLQGELVSGLHVEHNLQILLSAENRKKSNKVLYAGS